MKQVKLLAIFSLSTMLGLSACSSNSTKDIQTAEKTPISTSEQTTNEAKSADTSNKLDLDTSQKSDKDTKLKTQSNQNNETNSDIEKINKELSKDKNMPAEIVDTNGSV